MIYFVRHTHDDPQGDPVTHAHDLADGFSQTDDYEPATHTHLVVLGQRNFIHWYTSPARDWRGDAAREVAGRET